MKRIKRAILQTGRRLGLFGIARRLTRRKLRILCYHGFSLADEHEFRPGVFLRPSTFRRRLAYLAERRFSVLPLGEALDRMRQDRLPPAAVAITIDDGFFSVYDRALDILREFSFPATVYVSSYYCRFDHPVFRLAVQYMFWRTARRPVDLSGLDVPGLDGRGDDAETTMWKIIDHGETACNEPGRHALAAELGKCLDVDYRQICRSRILSLMEPEEISELPTAGIDVQLHTHRHRFPESETEVAREIADNRAFLQPLVDAPLEHFCYPSGVWSPNHWPPLSAAGVTSAVTCEPGFNDSSTPPLALRRFLDDEVIPQIEFEAEVTGFRGWFPRSAAV